MMRNIAKERALVVNEAREWLGTPYHPCARVKGAGVDCAMLPAEVYEACGVIGHIDVGPYPTDWHLHRSEERYLAGVTAHAHEVEFPLPGDFVLYRWGRCLAHGAIVVRWPTIIHAVSGEGVVLANGLAGRLKDRERHFYSLWKG
ncbi:MAG: hypothetical protein KGJ57_17380 [Sphingomonadales bacterium]|nr:hypothetical protein [Sphingomonadales bacterium]MDE2171170.1 hypothetical protein [Sphingomonadales bacterium]